MLLLCEFKLKRRDTYNGEVSKYWLNPPSAQDMIKAVLYILKNS